MRRAALIIPLLLSLVIVGCGGEQPSLEKGTAIPPFSLPAASGMPLSLPEALRGRVVLIHFWADWCPPCIEELQANRELARRRQGDGLSIVAVNMQQTPEQVKAVLETLADDYILLFDREGEVARRYGVTALPTSFLVDREGRLHTRILGALSAQEFEQLVETIL